ncbi:MAG: TspO/MBR family protein [Patescibacteria group bacterium]
MPCSRNFGFYLIAVLIALGAGWWGANGPTSAAWYESLNKPSYVPPGYIFSSVWVILFLLIAYAGYRGSVSLRSNRKLFVAWNSLFAIIMALSIAFPFIFFKLRNMAAAFSIIIAYLVVVFIMICIVWRADQTVAILLLPLLGWLIFSAFIQYQIWSLNPSTTAEILANTSE